jgi:hypothetical protein
VLRLESRPARVSGEEALEGLVEVAKWLRIGARRDLAQEGEFGIDASDEGLLQDHPVGFPSCSILAPPVIQRPIIGQAGTAGGFAEEPFLGWSRPQGDDMSEERHIGL